MNDFVVYKHIFPNGKQYVGITSQKPNRRWRNGEAYKYNRRMYNAIQKYGWEKIEHIILYSGLSREDACKKEIELICELKLKDERFGYNISDGGDHSQHSEETKRKIGESSRGRKHTEEFKSWISEKNKGSGNFMYGKHHTEETKKKISNRKIGCISPNKGKYGSLNPHSKKIAAVDVETESVICVYGSIVEAANEIGRSLSTLKGCLKGKQKTCAGYRWVYYE